MTRAILTAALASAAMIGGATSTAAQSAYPNVDQPMVLGPGDTVRLLNRIVVDRAPGQRGIRMDVHYATHVPSSDDAARGAQADRLAQVVGADAWKVGARRITIAICDTRACAETREPPRAWYVYERGIGGVWYRSRSR